MIGDLSKGQEKSSLVVIEDNSVAQGRGLLLSFIANLSQRVDEVHIVCYDGRSQDIQLLVPGTNIKIYKAYKDLLNWDGNDDVNVSVDIVKYIKEKNSFHGNKKIAIVIDSISQLILYRSASYTCQVIHRLANTQCLGCEVEQVVCLLHHDLHDDSSCSLIDHTASTVIRLKSSKSEKYNHCCEILHKKISGKITEINENFNISENFEVKDIVEVSKVISLPTGDDAQVDPAANLTFNLTLTDKEKEARSKVVLPYTYDKQRQEATLNKSVGEGKIFYQPDEIDDFDEEDPDDDLDI